ncbi:HlyD family type I secretion periplasmic adaptor subunit [Chroococcidiopsis sp. CCMEE 29]|uniref:HlyD family type I secretion periplasmic adaptor subunit n=1 Tax=Chroococcidiopsis sp. CCMEE 29 TaxID=155894 RepID=UPI00202024D1|nr:HlyD family type I secretion periplasmic adaptor subunit [Chroococcidiopsis sp. CCMEE 29]
MSNNNGAKLDRSNNGKGLNQVTVKTELPKSTETTTNLKVPVREASSTRKFEQPVILQQSPIWSRAILWVLMGVTTTTIIWACVARFEEAIPAQGKLEPQGTVKNIQAPVGGVVQGIYVEDGQRVKQGDRLISFDPTATVAQLASLQKIRTALIQENGFYRAQVRGLPFSPQVEQVIAQLKLPPELISLTKSRSALAAENQLYRAHLSGASTTPLTSEQQERLLSNQAELDTRVAAAQSEVAQLTRQLNQTQIQLANAKDKLAIERGIFKDIEPLAKQGALSRIQYLKQQQQVQASQAEASQLIQEQERLKLEIAGSQSKVQNTLALFRKDLLTQIAENDKGIAEIDTQLTKAIVENNNRIAEIDSQLSQAELTLKYQDLLAPADGTVFDLQAQTPGFVTNSTEPILKIVPDDALTAKVFITNRDIGFVKEGMTVDVRIDSFPFSEFGDVKGQLVWIGSDALPPDQVRPFYSFPAKIRLDQQAIMVNGRAVPLQSGMSVSGNIKVRQRTVMSIFTDLFTKKIEGLKFVR